MLLNCDVRRLLRVPWTARRSNQSILKEISPEYSLEGLIMKLKLQYFGHLMWRADLLKKTLMLEKIESRRRGQQRMRWLDGIIDAMDIINNIIESSFTSLKTLYAPLTHPSLPFYPLQPLIFFFPYSFFCLFWNVILLKLYSIWPFQTDFFHLSIHI